MWYLPSQQLSPKHRIVTGGSHQKEHGEREHEIRSRHEKTLTRKILRTVRDWRSISRIFARPQDDLLLRSPDHAPDIEHHHPSDAAANSNSEQAIAFPSMIVEAEKQATRHDHDDRVDDGEHRPFVEWAFARDYAGIHHGPGYTPDQKETCHWDSGS